LEPPSPSQILSLRKRKQLYSEILDDLQSVVDSDVGSEEDREIVRHFCQEKFDFLIQQEYLLQSQQRTYDLAQLAFQDAKNCRFREAIELLEKCLSEPCHDPLIEEYLSQVREQFSRYSLQKQLDLILYETNILLASHRFEEAIAKLEWAKTVTGRHPVILSALSSAKEQSAAYEASKALEASQVTPLEIPYAELVEPTATSLSDGSAATIETNASQELITSPPILTNTASLPTFTPEEEERISPIERLIDSASRWSSLLKPFLLDNVGWFIGTFLVIAGFVVLIVSFWGSIERNPILMHSLVYFSLAIATAFFFSAAYFMRLRYPQLESSSNVLLVIVALLIPLVFASAALTSLIPAVKTSDSTRHSSLQHSG
jgi:tetratricopeptide (TPR) repeat protein